MAFKDNLYYFRNKANLTQQELADKICVSRSLITRYEQGYDSPSLNTLMRLASAFNCSVNDLVYGPDKAREVRT